MILANESKGQCHKYKGKLISPNQTKTLFDKICLLSHAFGPENIMSAAPSVGISASDPGKADEGLIL